jgi:type II secretory ATPase GspE/PulE/Tfp pilus assembly ATPase PilB-like protein
MLNRNTNAAAANAAADAAQAKIDAASAVAADLAAGQRAPQMIDVAKFPTDKQVDALIDHAAGMGSSDLFFVSNDQHVAVLVRHLGLIKPISVLPVEAGRRAMAHIKALAGMDISEKRRPADGRWIFERINGDTIDLRINCIPTIYGEDFALRILARGSKLFQVENLGMTSQQASAFKQMVESPSGLILITGPTGSGKTATLYSSLIKLNDGTRKINTIEDPVEYTISGLRQSQVNPLITLGFSELLRSVLRQSPDVIMVGEIRDAETAQTAVHAGNSGMLVLATIHAPAAAGAVQSMRSLGVHSHFLSTSLRGIASQRLVRTFCMKCRRAFDLSDAPHTFDEVKQWLGPDEGKTLYAPGGCEACQMEGYAGRTGVFEVMPITRNIRNLISDGKPARDIRHKAVEEGMLEFRQAALLKVAKGETSTEEVFRVIPSEHLLLED